MISTIGLIVYIISVVAGGGLLIWDGHRAISGETTITEWATQKPAREWGIFAAIMTGAIGVLIHFLTFTN